jgi:hypothetical protein
MAVALVAGVTVGAGTPASAAPAWSVAANPKPPGPPKGSAVSVSCPSATSCFAVGETSGSTTLIEHWNGTGWSLVTSPNPASGVEAALIGVSCPTATSCFAVGFKTTSAGGRTFVVHWNGTTWSIVASANPTDGSTNAHLSGVSCPTATSCYAVGFKSTSSTIKTLVEHWNGSSWSIVASPNAGSGSTRSVLSSVSCPTDTSCYAVGYRSTSSATDTLVERWNGSSWSIATSPNPSGTTNSVLLGVSCSDATTCFAVGFDGTSALSLVEAWDGTSWSIVASPSPAGATYNALSGVRCASATSCDAVGNYGNSLGLVLSVVEHWDGTAWSVVTSPNPAGATNVNLFDVSCVTDTSCFAVGNEDNYTMIEHWNGATWSIVGAPTGGTESQLAQVSCPSATTCIAVGNFVTATARKTLVEQWNGTSWSLVATPVPAGAFRSVFNGVSCPSATSCFAVGSSSDQFGSTATLVEQWSGSSWSIVPSPNQTGTSSTLSGVSCTSSTSCVAVGSWGDQSSPQTLVEQWDGTSWSIVTTPSPAGALGDALSGVSCTSATSCHAVGNFFDASTTRTLVEDWDGTTWSVVTSPNPAGAQTAGLSGVSCSTSTSCFAVGESVAATGKTLAEQWNGTSWSIVSTPNPSGAGESLLSGVSCPTATSCYAVGYAQTNLNKALAEQWNGTSWSIATVPKPALATEFILSGVSCSAATTCYAVGDYTSPANDYTLIEAYA